MLYAKDMDRVAGFYAAVLGLETAGSDEEHVLLESRAFQLVVLRMPSHIASTIQIAVPPVPRASWLTRCWSVKLTKPVSQNSLTGSGYAARVH